MIWSLPFLLLLALFLWGIISSNLILKIQRNTLDFNPRSFGYEYESFRTLTEDGVRIDGWFVPCKNKSKSTIIVLHGWGANRSDVIPSTIFLCEKYNLAYFDFRNHGLSGGHITSLTCLEIKDFVSVAHFLKKEKKEFCQNLGIFGFSMGASVAISGSVRIKEVNAIVAESPFSSYNETIIRFAKLFFGIPKITVPFTLWFARMRLGFDPQQCSPIYSISQIAPRPILIIQAGSDVRMPVSEGQKLYELAGEPKELWVIPDADHGDVHEVVGKEYDERILNFFQKWMKN